MKFLPRYGRGGGGSAHQLRVPRYGAPLTLIVGTKSMPTQGQVGEVRNDTETQHSSVRGYEQGGSRHHCLPGAPVPLRSPCWRLRRKWMVDAQASRGVLCVARHLPSPRCRPRPPRRPGPRSRRHRPAHKVKSDFVHVCVSVRGCVCGHILLTLVTILSEHSTPHAAFELHSNPNCEQGDSRRQAH